MIEREVAILNPDAVGKRMTFIVGVKVDYGQKAEVAAHLVNVFDCPPAHARDLAHVAEYVALTKGVGPLYDELHGLFAPPLS